jgi:hypothetical protein
LEILAISFVESPFHRVVFFLRSRNLALNNFTSGLQKIFQVLLGNGRYFNEAEFDVCGTVRDDEDVSSQFRLRDYDQHHFVLDLRCARRGDMKIRRIVVGTVTAGLLSAFCFGCACGIGVYCFYEDRSLEGFALALSLQLLAASWVS